MTETPDHDEAPEELTEEEVRAILRAKVLRAAQLPLREPPPPPPSTHE